jgi:hypothetical protein
LIARMRNGEREKQIWWWEWLTWKPHLSQAQEHSHRPSKVRDPIMNYTLLVLHIWSIDETIISKCHISEHVRQSGGFFVRKMLRNSDKRLVEIS